MSNIIQWFRDHHGAIFATAFCMAKAGLLGTAGSAIVSSLAAAFSQ